MCVIIVKNKTALKPTQEILRKCHIANSDSIGIALQEKNHLVVYRNISYKDLSDINAAMGDDQIALYPFRIATSGKIDTKNSHPFPLFSKLDRTIVRCNEAIAHNGIISGLGNKIESDTFQLTKLLEHTSEDIRYSWLDLLCENSTNKIAHFVGKEHTIYTFGFWHEDIISGLQFSNLIWKTEYITPKNTITKYHRTSCKACTVDLLPEEESIGLCIDCQTWEKQHEKTKLLVSKNNATDSTTAAFSE